jgi:hypothetical protein
LVAVGRMLIGDVGVDGGVLVEEIARQRPAGEAAAAQRKTLLVPGRQRSAAPQLDEAMLVGGR